MGDVKVSVDLSGAERKIGKGNLERGRYVMANQMLADMQPYVPMDEGSLSASGMVGKGGETLSWDTPYAKRWFYTPANFQRTHHPYATNRWDLEASALYMEEWKQIFIKGANLR